MSPILPAILDLKQVDGNEILKGSDWSIEITIVDRIANVDTPFNLQGFEGLCQIRASAVAPTLVAEPTVTITNAAGGTLTISLTESQTALIPTTGATYRNVSVYQYELQLINKETGEAYRALQGFVEVSPTIIRVP